MSKRVDFFPLTCYAMIKKVVVLQIIRIKDIIRPPAREKFNDVYIAYELMDTDLHQITRSSQALTDDHCQVTSFLLPL